MNAAVFLMTSALMAGGEPVAAPESAPAVISTGSACTNCGSAPIQHYDAPVYGGCGTCADIAPCCPEEKPGLCTRIKLLFKRSDPCPAPSCCDAPTYHHAVSAPACDCQPVSAPACGCETVAAPCNTCGDEKPGLFTRLKLRLKGGDAPCPTEPCCGHAPGNYHYGSYAAPHGHVIEGAPAHPAHPAPPAEMPDVAPSQPMPKGETPMITPAPMNEGAGDVNGGIGYRNYGYPQVTPVATPKSSLPLGGVQNPF